MRIFSFSILICILLSACDIDENPSYPILTNSTMVTEVNFTGSTQNVTLMDLYNNNIFLVKINTSAENVDMTLTGGAVSPIPFANKLPELKINTISLITGHPGATLFQANPQFIPNNTILSRSPTYLASSNTVGDKYSFWVETVLNSNNFIQREAILQAIGEHCKVWVMPNTDYTKTITRTQAQTLAQKFDIIYPAATNLLGYEFGGGPDGIGGRDGDPKIHILVYDIGKEYGGYFHPKDYYTQEQLNISNNHNLMTNNAEIFYIGAEQANENPDFTYSSLIHEFQHMINWNVKTIKKDLEADTWYNEMLSIMAEDVMSSLIGIATSSNGHVQQIRMPLFLACYFLTGITEWEQVPLNLSYSYKYAYGAYLLRNYGGAAILKEIISNNFVNEASITAALGNAYNNNINFQYTLKRFGEALLYTRPLPDGVMSFDKTVSNTINGITYTINGFNIWNYKNINSDTIYDINYYFNSKGPFIISLDYWSKMPRHAIALFSHESWLNVTGNVLITLEKPADPNIKFIIMVK